MTVVKYSSRWSTASVTTEDGNEIVPLQMFTYSIDLGLSKHFEGGSNLMGSASFGKKQIDGYVDIKSASPLLDSLIAKGDNSKSFSLQLLLSNDGIVFSQMDFQGCFPTMVSGSTNQDGDGVTRYHFTATDLKIS